MTSDRLRRALGAAALIAALATPGLSLAGADCTARAEGTTQGFYAAAMVTSDGAWREKWAKTPRMTRPDFTAATSLGAGDTGRLLVFFSNPLTDMGGAHINCSLRVTRPNGKVSHLAPTRCFDDPLGGPAAGLYMAGMGADLKISPDDPGGTWTVEIDLTDALAQRTVPLRFCYDVTTRPGGQG